MPTDSTATDQTWRSLWSRAAYDIISSFPATASYERIQSGLGWGLRSRSDHQRAMVLHPSEDEGAAGDLSLTVLGQGTQVIARGSHGYPEYLDEVARMVETAL